MERKLFFGIMGTVIAIISFYFLWKVGYHLINYHKTGGLDIGGFGYPKPFIGVLTLFLFWLAMFSGGIGIITDSKFGLLLGLIGLTVSIIPTIAFLFVEIGIILNYSRELGINNTSREMRILDKWEYIYKNFIYLSCLLFFLMTAIILIYRRRKMIKIENLSKI